MKGGQESLRNKARKVRKQQGYDNVYIFPGLIQRLIKDAQQYMFRGMFEQAIYCYEEVERLDPHKTDFYDLYTVALYELGEHHRLIPYARTAIEPMREDTFELFRLLNMSLLQLGRFEEVQDLLLEASNKSFYDREALQFFKEYIEEEFGTVKKNDEIDKEKTSANHFSSELLKSQDNYTQLAMLKEIGDPFVSDTAKELVKVVEDPSFPMFVRTSAFSLLIEAEYEQPVSFHKYDLEGQFIPKDVPEIGNDHKSEQIVAYLNELLAKEPSLLAYAFEVYEHVLFNMYPHQWPHSFDAYEIAQAFVQHVKNLISGNDEIPSDPLLHFIQKIEFEEDI